MFRNRAPRVPEQRRFDEGQPLAPAIKEPFDVFDNGLGGEQSPHSAHQAEDGRLNKAAKAVGVTVGGGLVGSLVLAGGAEGVAYGYHALREATPNHTDSIANIVQELPECQGKHGMVVQPGTPGDEYTGVQKLDFFNDLDVSKEAAQHPGETDISSDPAHPPLCTIAGANVVALANAEQFARVDIGKDGEH
jgi:hypothetical protein